MTYKTILI